MDTELNTTMVPPFNLGSGLGSSPNPVSLSQNTFPPLSQSATNKKRQRPDSDDETNTFSFFKHVENLPKFIVIKSENQEKTITTLSPFVIEKQIEATIGTPKSVKKLKNQTLLVETTRKAQTDNLLKMTTFFQFTCLCIRTQNLKHM